MKSLKKKNYSFKINLFFLNEKIYKLYKENRSAKEVLKELELKSRIKNPEFIANGYTFGVDIPEHLSRLLDNYEKNVSNLEEKLKEEDNEKHLASEGNNRIKKIYDDAHNEAIKKHEAVIKRLLEIAGGKEVEFSNNRRRSILRIGEKFLSKYDRIVSEAKEPVEKLLIVAKNLSHCPSCGRYKQPIIEKLTVCSAKCEFNSECPLCLYLYNFGTLGNELVGCCEKCFASYEPEKLKKELRKMFDAKTLNALDEKIPL